ncbi:MAG: hypothetical protein ACRCUP_03725 [Mycoplasmatales bacterium]
MKKNETNNSLVTLLENIKETVEYQLYSTEFCNVVHSLEYQQLIETYENAVTPEEKQVLKNQVRMLETKLRLLEKPLLDFIDEFGKQYKELQNGK